MKSTLSNLPIYVVSVFKCPAKVISQTERLQCDFYGMVMRISRSNILWHGIRCANMKRWFGH